MSSENTDEIVSDQVYTEEPVIQKQTRSKKIPALVRNAIKSQTPAPVIKQVVVENIDEDDDESVDVAVDTLKVLGPMSKNPTGRPCPGCYHCNWTGYSGDEYGCTLQYYGSQN